MKNLNDLIWNPEDDGSVAPAGIGGDGDHMKDICMEGFCFDEAVLQYACGPAVQGTAACLPVGND